jgi:uncharacterized protein YodC (DUF2158 family)
MNELKFAVGNRVRHNSTKNSPAMVVIEIKPNINQRGDILCQYWHNDDFRTKSFIAQELVLLAETQP